MRSRRVRWAAAAFVVGGLVVGVAVAARDGGNDAPSERDVEEFAHVEIPASATGLRTFSESGIDTRMLASFRLPRRDLPAFIASGGFAAPLEAGERPSPIGGGEALAWRLDEIDRVAGLEEPVGDVYEKIGVVRSVVVDLDRPDHVVVYLSAATL